jgi:hypothetical protein
MSKNTKDTDQAQIHRFRETARQLGCDEDEAAFDEKLGTIARDKPERGPTYDPPFKQTCSECGAIFDEAPPPGGRGWNLGFNLSDTEACLHKPTATCPRFVEARAAFAAKPESAAD